MTFTEQIVALPADQRRAARALYGHVDEQRIADAVHLCVPDPIVAWLAAMSVRRVHEITDAFDARARALATVD